jgi:BlaI family penicillinase repressor
MAEPARPPLSDAEREILKELWERGPGTVRAIQARMARRGPEWQRSTVITLLQRLEKKGYVVSDKSEPTFVFRAAVSREDLMHQRIAELAEDLCDGEPAPLLLAFAQRQKFTAEQLVELRSLIDDLTAEASKRSRSRHRGNDDRGPSSPKSGGEL